MANKKAALIKFPKRAIRVDFYRLLFPAVLIFTFMTGSEILAQKTSSAGRLEKQTVCRVKKDGDKVDIKCFFSPDQDLLYHVHVCKGKGRNNQITFGDTTLVAADTNSGVQAKEELIHFAEDDCTPWLINGTYIGGNHGCSNARELTCPGHNKTVSDLGSEWKDSAGVKFYIIKIVDTNRVWVLSENKGSNDVWKFVTTITGGSLTNTSSSDVMNISSNWMAQVTPACRIQKQEYLIDGKTPLPENREVECAYLDIVEEYDIINPGSLLDKIRRSPGQEVDFAGQDLAGVIHNSIIYRFLPNGAVVVQHTSKALQQFMIGYMGFIQSIKLETGKSVHGHYIPKTKPFSIGGTNFDFQAIQDFRASLPFVLHFNSSTGTIATGTVADEQNLPDRFIQLLGARENGKFTGRVAFAMGYSPVSGITKIGERPRYTSSAGCIYPKKTYPSALNNRIGDIVPAGTVFNCTAYRVYFDPRRNPNATCVYWYKENNDYLVYLDYHRNVENEVVVLPPEMRGKKMSILEKTPSFSLRPDKTVPENGIMLSVTNEYGYAVLRVAD